MDWEQQDVTQESKSVNGPKCQVTDLGFYTVGREKPLEVFLFGWFCICVLLTYDLMYAKQHLERLV